MKTTTIPRFCTRAALSVLAALFAACTTENHAPVPPPSEVTVTGAYELHKGEPLGTLALTGTALCGGQPVPGALSWKEPETTYDNMGEYDAAWVFTPVDKTRYAGAEGTVAVTCLPDVYICSDEAADGKRIARVWKNGGLLYTPASENQYVFTTSLAVSDGKVYTCGYEGWGNNGVIWENDARLYTTDHAYFESLAVSEGDIYTCGSSNYVYALAWKNGDLLYTLTDGNNYADSNSLVISDGVVYTCGYETINGVDVAKVWRNGEPLYTLTDGHAVPNSLVVSDGVVYTCGFEKINGVYVARVWRNGDLLYTLTDGNNQAEAKSLAVSDGVVYTCGYETINGVDVARVWRNGELLYTLTDGSEDAMALSVAVSDGVVYTCGYEKINGVDVARVWRNGEPLYTVAGAQFNSLFLD